MNSVSPGAFVAQLRWPEVAQRISDGAVAVLPIGAACKQHGPHLPMNADFLQADWLSKVLVQRADVLIWPIVSYGYYPAFTDYPGSVSLANQTFAAMVREILNDIRRSGARAALILNTGISTIAPLQSAVDELQEAMPITLANVYQGRRYCSLTAEIEEQVGGGHADELETSILVAMDRAHVDLDKAETWTPVTMAAKGPFSRSDPGSPRFSPSGVWGDPTLASEEKGRRLLAAIVEDLLNAVEATARSISASPE